MLTTHVNIAPVNAISKQELECEAHHIINYRMGLAVVDALYKRGDICEPSYEKAKGLIAQQYNINNNSIYR